MEGGKLWAMTKSLFLSSSLPLCGSPSWCDRRQALSPMCMSSEQPAGKLVLAPKQRKTPPSLSTHGASKLRHADRRNRRRAGKYLLEGASLPLQHKGTAPQLPLETPSPQLPSEGIMKSDSKTV